MVVGGGGGLTLGEGGGGCVTVGGVGVGVVAGGGGGAVRRGVGGGDRVELVAFFVISGNQEGLKVSVLEKGAHSNPSPLFVVSNSWGRRAWNRLLSCDVIPAVALLSIPLALGPATPPLSERTPARARSPALPATAQRSAARERWGAS